MSIDRIYAELQKMNTDEHYIELAKTDVLFIPVIIDIMLDKISPLSLWAESLLEKISSDNPLIVYPYIGYISSALDKSSSFNNWNVWKIIANILECDYRNQWELLRAKYFNSLNSERITEFSISCDCAVKIISAKPNEKDAIVGVLKDIDSRKFYIGDTLSPECCAVAKEKSEEVLKTLGYII